MGTYAELERAFGDIQELPHQLRHTSIVNILKTLESLFGEEVLEYIILMIGSRLKMGQWMID